MENNRSNSIVGLEKAKLINELNLTTAKIGELKNSNPIDNYEIAKYSYKVRILSEKLRFLKSINSFENFLRVYYMSDSELEEIKSIMKIDIQNKLLNMQLTKNGEFEKYNELKKRKRKLENKEYLIDTDTPEDIQLEIDNISSKIALHYTGVNSVFLELKRSFDRLQGKLYGLKNKGIEEIRIILYGKEVPSVEKRNEYRKLLTDYKAELSSKYYVLSKTDGEYEKVRELASLLTKIGYIKKYSYSYEYSIPVYKALPKKVKERLLFFNTFKNGDVFVSNPTSYYNEFDEYKKEEFTELLNTFYHNYTRDALLQVITKIDSNNISKEFFEFHSDKIKPILYKHLMSLFKKREKIKSINIINRKFVEELDKSIYENSLIAQNQIYNWYLKFNSEFLDLGKSSLALDEDKLDEELEKWKEMVEIKKEALDNLLDHLNKISNIYTKRWELLNKKREKYRQQIIDLYADGYEDVYIPDNYYTFDEALEAIMDITLEEYKYNIVNTIRRQANKIASCREVEIKNRFKGDSSEEAYAYDLKL